MMNRRTFLKTATAAAMTPLLGTRRASAAAKPPNIVVILADDMGFSDIGCYGGEIHTPHLDRMAEEGVRFTQFYNAARCCPTRASLLTGLYPHQAGVGEMVSNPSNPRPQGPYQGYLNDRCLTIPEALRGAGYRSYMSGKWHVGEAREYWPRQRGFDRYFGLISGASSYWELLEEPPRERFMALDDTPWKPTGDGFYMTDAFTDHAVTCLREHPQDQPFFQYIAYTAPHWPLHAPRELIEKYRGKFRDGWDALREARYARQRAIGLAAPNWRLAPRDPDVPAWESVEDKEHWDLLMAIYAAMMENMDANIGRVLQTLEETGAAENTLVMFLSDNGGCAEDIAGRNLHQPDSEPGQRGSYLAYLKPWAHLSNTPFRRYKQHTHEGGIATPLVARWPAVIDAGGQTEDVGHVVDILPTCLDLAGIAQAPDTTPAGAPATPPEGLSLRPVFETGKRAGHEFLAWEHFDNRAIRQGDWKLVAPKEGPWELYDLGKDRSELDNLLDSQPEKAQALHEQYESWAKRVGVPREPAAT